MFELTLTLRNGTTHAERVAVMPKYWKSWLMQRMPYGTDFFGATFSRRAI